MLLLFREFVRFSGVDPDNAKAYLNNGFALHMELLDLDTILLEKLTGLQGKKFFVFHPAFGYLAKDHDLVQVAVETGGASPGPKHIKKLIEDAKAAGVKVIFVQKQFPSRAAETIAERIGGSVVPLDPLAKNYLQNMKLIATELERSMGK